MDALRRNPAVLHLATHVLFPPQDSSPGLVALSLTHGGELEFLSATEIASMRLNLGLVVLNGCSSARAAILPGAGLMGMTRAWLAAGARAVIVTRWATPIKTMENSFNPSTIDFLPLRILRPEVICAVPATGADSRITRGRSTGESCELGGVLLCGKKLTRVRSPAQPEVDWKAVVEQIRAGDPAGEESSLSESGCRRATVSAATAGTAGRRRSSPRRVPNRGRDDSTWRTS